MRASAAVSGANDESSARSRSRANPVAPRDPKASQSSGVINTVTVLVLKWLGSSRRRSKCMSPLTPHNTETSAGFMRDSYSTTTIQQQIF